MVSVSGLPLVAIDRIAFYYSYLATYRIVTHWKNRLQLLKVNRLWRQAATHRIYHLMYVNYGLKSDQITVRSNIDLIISLGYYHKVNYIYIPISNLDCLAAFFRQYESLFQFGKQNWKNVNKIRLKVHKPIMFSSLANNEDEARRVFPFETFASRLAECIPNVGSFCYFITDETGVATPFTNILLNTYGKKLWKIKCASINFNISHEFMNITYIDIVIDPSVENLLPRLNPSRIKSLILSEIPQRFSWKYFQMGQSANDAIEFASLKVLSLTFLEESIDDESDNESSDSSDDDSDEDVEVNRNNQFGFFGFNNPGDDNTSESEDEEDEDDIDGMGQDNHTENTQIHTVHLPNLKQIFIRNTPGSSVMSSTYTFPKQLEAVSVIDSIHATSILVSSNLVYVNSVFLQFRHIPSEQENMFYNSNNTILNYCANNSGDAMLKLVKTDFTIDYSQLQWSNLRILEMTKMGFAVFEYMLESCLRTVYVEIGLLEMTDTLEYYQSRLLSLNISASRKMLKKIEIVTLKCNGNTAEKAQLLSTYLLKNFASMEHISIPPRAWSKENNRVTETRYSFEQKKYIKASEWTIC